MSLKNSRAINVLTIILYMSLFMISSESFNGQLISLGAALISVVIVIIDGMLNGGRIYFKVTALHYWMILFVLFCYTSSLWALQPGLSISKGNSIIKCAICIVLIYMYYQKADNVKTLLKLIMYGGYILILFSVAFFGISSLTDTVASSARLEAGFLNQNTLGMLAALTIIINIYFIIYYKEQLILLPVLVLSVIVLAAAGSRKGLIEIVVGILMISLIKNYERRKLLKSIFRIMIILTVLAALIYGLSKLPMFDFLNMRIQNVIHQLSGNGVTDYSVRSRALLNQLGWKLFSENPIIGIGMDCPRIPARQLTGVDWYLHNNYLEILAGGGIIGGIIYYSIYIMLIARFIKYKSARDPEYDICLVMMILQLVLQFAYVAYYSRETYIYLMVYYLESEIIKSRALENNKSVVI